MRAAGTPRVSRRHYHHNMVIKSLDSFATSYFFVLFFDVGISAAAAYRAVLTGDSISSPTLNEREGPFVEPVNRVSSGTDLSTKTCAALTLLRAPVFKIFI